MLVKIDRAHWYRGEPVKGPNGARKKKYELGAIVEVPSDYYETYMEPYSAAHPHNAKAAAAKDLVKKLQKQTKQQLADLAEDRDVKVGKGSGAGGAITKRDLIVVLSKAGIEPAGEGED